MLKKKLIILGSSVTALAVARNATDIGFSPVVFDIRPGVAFHSSIAQTIFCEGKTDSELLAMVVDLGQEGRNALIATSDRWIDFLIEYRTILEQAFDTVLQASNDVLRICTDKFRFAVWCDDNAVPAPHLFAVDSHGSLLEKEVDFPLLVRPYKGIMNLAATGLPKAKEVKDWTSLTACLQTFRNLQVQPIVTQSLLRYTLSQYSVGLVRSDVRLVSFVAKKERPTPDQCAVGSYVVLCENPVAEQLARDVAVRLDYYGIAEFEILHAQETGCYYLIEINARPWFQYGLGPKSGHDFLQVLLDGDSYDSKQEHKTGKYWIDFSYDLYNCFSTDVGLVRGGKVTVMTYLRSLFYANVFAKWSLWDQKPFWMGLRQLIDSAIFRRGT